MVSFRHSTIPLSGKELARDCFKFATIQKVLPNENQAWDTEISRYNNYFEIDRFDDVIKMK